MAEQNASELSGDDYVALNGPDGTVLLIPVDVFMKGPPEFDDEAPRAARPPRTNAEKDVGLQRMLDRVRDLLPETKSAWCQSSTPYSALLEDCRELAGQPEIAEAVRVHLDARPAVRQAADMLVTATAMSANADWRRAPDVLRATAARGWFLNRWLPTFLIVDGPISDFMNSIDRRPKAIRPKAFSAAKKLLDGNTFGSIRNAFAHWSFGWETKEREHWILIYDRDTGLETLRFHQQQGDALHMIAWSVVDALNQVFFRRPNT